MVAKTGKPSAPKKKAAAKAAKASAKPAKAARSGVKPAPAPEPEPQPPPEVKPSPTGAEVPLVSLAEVAQMLKISPLQVKQMVQAGRIPGVKVEGEWKFNKDLVYEAFHRRSRGW